MFKKLKNRFFAGLAIMIALFVMLGVSLGNLTLTQGGELTVQSEDKKVRTVSVKASRGQITDATGIPLAYDQSSYEIQFVKDPSKNSTTDKAYYTNILIEVIDIVEKNGGEMIDTFSIVRNEDGTFAFDFGVTDPDAIKKREEDWRKNMFVSKTSSPDVLYRDLRIRYRIPEEYTYEQARKLLSIWQQVQLSSYLAYVPVTISKNIDMDTVSLVEAKSDVFDGIQIGENSTRIYPKDEVAAHIVGHLGKMTDQETIQEYKNKGYSPDDLIGASGIESTMEQYLTGNSKEKQGSRVVEVNSKGKVIQERSYTPATSGYNVRLTLDLQLQQVAEKALENNVNQVYEAQIEKYNKDRQDYDENTEIQEALANRKEGNSDLEKMNLAKSGAVVVMDTKTGKILAMSSYPSYDANIFTGGIAQEEMDKLNDDPARPLFNNAISSKGIPGSIFKMVTGMAGLQEGAITLNTTITDEGIYPLDDKIKEGEQVTGRVPTCWAYHPGMTVVPGHVDQNLVKGLEHSCNYYFYEVANRIVQTTGTPDTLAGWGEKFGLSTLSGVELTGEAVGQVGNQSVLYDPSKPISAVNSEGVEYSTQKTSLPLLVRNVLISDLREFGVKRQITYSDEQLKETAEKLIQKAGEDLTDFQIGEQIRTILNEDLQIPVEYSHNQGWDNAVNSRLSELRWNTRQTITTGIGSGTTAVTPVAVARYISSLVNGGDVFEAHIVDSVVDDSGNVIEKQEPVVFNHIDAPKEYFDAIKQGMREVVAEEQGTASKAFDGWKYKDEIIGKTGTGRVSAIDLENNAWFVACAPYDDPEITVVVYIPNGLGGSQAIPAAKDIIEYYLDGKVEETGTEIPSNNVLIP